MPKILHRLRIDEVASVDKGAGEDVHVKLIKAKKPFGEKKAPPFGSKDDDEEKDTKKTQPVMPKSGADALLTDDETDDGFDGDDCVKSVEGWTPYWKREYTTEQRRAMSHNGQAMPGGGYPIADAKDLRNAVQAIGRAKKPNKTKQHIMSRANALGLTHHIPDKWMMKSIKKSCKNIVAFLKSDGGEDFSADLAVMQTIAIREGIVEAVHTACKALESSVKSIVDDGDVVEKSELIRESFGQFLDHVAGLSPIGEVAKAWKEKVMAKTFNKAIGSSGQSDTTNRSAEIRDKGKTVTIVSEGDGEEDVNQPDNKIGGASEKKTKVWRDRFDALVSMDKASRDYLVHPDNLMEKSEVASFVDMSKADRAKFIEENPIGKMTEKRMADLPEPLRKQLEAGAKAAEALAKREDAEILATLTKRAADNKIVGEGVPEALVKLAKADGESLDVVLKALEVMTKAVASQDRTAVIFKEFGSSQAVDGDTGAGSAHEQLTRKAEQYQVEQEKIGKAMTIQQAYEIVCQKRENTPLFQIAKREGAPVAA